MIITREQVEMIVWHYEPQNGARIKVLNEPQIDEMLIREQTERMLTKAGFSEEWDCCGPCGWSKHIVVKDLEIGSDEYYAEHSRQQQLSRDEEKAIKVKAEQLVADPEWRWNMNHELDNRVLSEKRWKENGPYVVIATRTSSRYGGAEEGGWYYGSDEMVKWCALPTYQMAVWLAEMMNREHKMKRDGLRDNLGALGGDETVSSNYPEGFIPSGWVSSSEIHYRVSNQCLEPEDDGIRPHYC
jgi:hypothetical protein